MYKNEKARRKMPSGFLSKKPAAFAGFMIASDSGQALSAIAQCDPPFFFVQEAHLLFRALYKLPEVAVGENTSPFPPPSL